MIASIPLSILVAKDWRLLGKSQEKINHGLHFFYSILKFPYPSKLCAFIFFISRNTLLVENVIIGLQNETQKKQARKQTN